MASRDELHALGVHPIDREAFAGVAAFECNFDLH
jgi:hypothetical protein